MRYKRHAFFFLLEICNKAQFDHFWKDFVDRHYVDDFLSKIVEWRYAIGFGRAV